MRDLIRCRPDYFEEEFNELFRLHRDLGAIGRNLSQIARSLNSGKPVALSEVSKELDLTRQELEGVRAFIRNKLESAT